MTEEALNFFYSPEGRKILERYKNIDEKELQNLPFVLQHRKDVLFRPELVTLLTLRLKAKDKFTKAEEMFFTSDGLEQASDEKISEYIAKRFTEVLRQKAKVSDLTSGIGGNTIFLAKYFHVLAIDHDKTHIFCAKNNSKVYGVDSNIEFIYGKAEDNIRDSEAFLVDPQRLRQDKTKTRSFVNSSPDILILLPQIMKITKNICIKISPAFDYEELERLPDAPEVEIISEKNNNKAALLWFGDFKTCDRRATILTQKKIISFINNPADKAPFLEHPLSFVYEPNKAIIKAHLIDEIANRYSLYKLNPYTAFLTSDKYIEDSAEIFRVFELIDCQPFSFKVLKKLLSDKGIVRANVTTRRFPEKPENIIAKLKLKEGGDHTIIVTVLNDEKYYFFLTKNKRTF